MFMKRKANYQNMKKFNYLIILIFSICSCKSDDERIKFALETAGENRSELEKVILHYKERPQDSLKLKAAIFLIANMPLYNTLNSKQLINFDSVFDSVAHLKPPQYVYQNKYTQLNKYINGKIKYIGKQNAWNYFVKKCGAPDTFKLQTFPDCRNITADFLIENIEYAFKAWDFPWAKHLTFEQFCEYVLPYRFSNEPLESWRPFFMEKYKWVLDSVKNPNDPVEVCALINKDIGTWFQFDGAFKYPRSFMPSQLVKFGMGGCILQAAVSNFAMRSMGLAIAHEQVPQWGDRSLGHDFSAVLSKEGKFIDFLGGELPPGSNELRNNPPKIFRNGFSYRPNPLRSKDKIAPSKLASLHYLDVSSSYISVSDVTIPIKIDRFKDPNFVFLCVFNNKGWEAVQFAKIKDSKATFENMGRNILYLPALYENKNYIPAGDPFILSKDGKINFVILDQAKTQRVVLSRKYPYSPRLVKLANGMIGAKFQGANKSDFSDAVDLHTVTSSPSHYFKEYSVKQQMFRYVRYIFPPSTPDSIRDGDLSELGFIGLNDKHQEVLLNGDHIRSSEITKFQDSLLFDQRFDNYYLINVADTIIENYPKHVITIPKIKPLWIGMDLGKKHTITKVAYCPRNDMNNLYERCEYELMYWNKGWVSLGKKRPKNYELMYENVPVGALLLLHNRTEGKEERIFIYKDGKQIWW
jgi:hypothetical protein